MFESEAYNYLTNHPRYAASSLYDDYHTHYLDQDIRNDGLLVIELTYNGSNIINFSIYTKIYHSTRYYPIGEPLLPKWILDLQQDLNSRGYKLQNDY